MFSTRVLSVRGLGVLAENTPGNPPAKDFWHAAIASSFCFDWIAVAGSGSGGRKTAVGR
jgi:hypothetical protein